MKRLTLVLLVLGSSMTYAQETYREMSTDQALEVHSGITAGWFIDQKCKLLSAEDAANLDKNRGTVTQQLMRTWNPQIFPMVEETSKELAADKPYKSCGRDAKEAVLDAVRLAKEWATEIAASPSS